MKLHSVMHNNRRQVLEVRTHAGKFLYPFSRVEPTPTAQDPIRDSFLDPEAAREAFTFVLRSGRAGTIHIEQLLEYNRDPTYLRDLLLYRMTLEAQKRIAESPLSKRQVVRQLETSMPKLERLLDQTNRHKSVDQVLALLHLLNCEVDLVIRTTTT